MSGIARFVSARHTMNMNYYPLREPENPNIRAPNRVPQGLHLQDRSRVLPTIDQWTNPWVSIRIDARHNTELCAYDGPKLTDAARQLLSLDSSSYDHPQANSILEAKIDDEMAQQYELLVNIIAVDGRQKDKSYEAILRERAKRYSHRLERYRWEKLFKAANNVEGARAPYIVAVADETPISNHRRALYKSVVQWLEKDDEKHRALELGWEKCRYVTEKVLEEIVKFTEELWEERQELERVYREHNRKPPAFYQGNWTGPLKEAD